MIRHLLKLVWHRKRANALIMTEIFLSFLIVFAVATIAISLYGRWRAPLGFEWQNVWTMEVETAAVPHHSEGLRMTAETSSDEKTHAQLSAEAVDRLLREVRTFPEVEAAAADAMPAYMPRTWTTQLGYKGHQVPVYADTATDDFARAMKLQVLKGRWFTDDDEAQNYQAIVLDADAARALFGNREPVGQKLPAREFNEDPSLPNDFRVVGVIAPYRKFGEFTQRDLKMVFFRVPNVAPKSPSTHGNFTIGPEGNQIVIRVRPGTPASFEAELSDRLRPSASGITYRIRRMDATRKTMLQTSIAPVLALSVVALFLILMVALGLTGVLWQTVTRRTREIGLRRAVGASGAGVRAQVIGEVAVLVTLAVILATIVIAQLPLLGVFRLTTPGEVALGFSAALAGIYAITLLCGAYPSWLASTVDPAEALRYE
jgi:putative ABC transport system permease protein